MCLLCGVDEGFAVHSSSVVYSPDAELALGEAAGKLKDIFLITDFIKMKTIKSTRSPPSLFRHLPSRMDIVAAATINSCNLSIRSLTHGSGPEGD